jgi:hypothetical protein
VRNNLGFLILNYIGRVQFALWPMSTTKAERLK